MKSIKIILMYILQESSCSLWGLGAGLVKLEVMGSIPSKRHWWGYEEHPVMIAPVPHMNYNCH